VSGETWRPLGVQTDGDVASYDALHDGIPSWMAASFWAWIRAALTRVATYSDGSGRFGMLDVNLAEAMCQTLRITLPNLRVGDGYDNGQRQIASALNILQKHRSPLQIADYLLAHAAQADEVELEEILTRSNSVWRVGSRAGKKGLDRRVALGVQMAGDRVISQSGQAGVRLAEAWGELLGLEGSPSEAYRLAILAIEEAVVPIVSPTNTKATLGSVLKQIEDQKDWRLPMGREHVQAPSGHMIVSLMRLVWHGQHDRHGGQPSAPGAVTEEEARIAVMSSVTLVDWFTGGLVQRGGQAGTTDPA